MISVVLVAAGLAVRSWPLVVLGAMVVMPAPALVGALLAWAVWSWHRRPRRADAEDVATLALAIASELRGGRGVRAALPAGAVRATSIDLTDALRRSEAGRPAGEIADALAASVPVLGLELGAAFRLAADSGARSGPVFTRFARAAAELAEMARQTRIASAQAKASALVVALAPVVLVGVMVATGSLSPAWFSAGPGALTAGLGAGLVVAGVAAVWSMSRRYLA